MRVSFSTAGGGFAGHRLEANANLETAFLTDRGVHGSFRNLVLGDPGLLGNRPAWGDLGVLGDLGGALNESSNEPNKLLSFR